LDPLGRDEFSVALTYTDAGRLVDSLGALRYSDAIAYWTHRLDRLELSAGGGFRFAATRGSTAETWASGSAVLWVVDRAAIVISAGRALADIARGVPSVRYLSVSVRLGTGLHLSSADLHVRRDRIQLDDGSIAVRAGADSQRLVSVRLGAVSTVELMADFTDWEAVSMDRAPSGEWRIERTIAPGTHRVAIRVNGGKWIVPPNLPRVADEFGGDVGLVIVP
jgi:hypothetical protein